MNMGMNFIKNYTSLDIIKINSKEIAGFEINNKYYLINKKCDKTLQSISKTITKDELSKMIKQILLTLKMYQEKGLHHNDLKMDNIMICDNKYTLIDLDLMLDNNELYKFYKSKKSSKHKRPYGSEFITSPLAIYTFTGSPNNILNKLPVAYIRALVKSIPFSFSSMKKYVTFYNDYILKNNKEFIQIHKNKDPLEIFDLYKDTFDVYSLGVTIAQIYFIQNETLPEYFIEYVKCLTNPINPNYTKNAQEAYKLFQKFEMKNI
jgi:serine/threonine protein kinase